MLPTFRIFRISKTRKEFDDCQIKQANAAVVHSRKVLTDNPLPDTFMGRKTQEPFAEEDADSKIEGFKGLNPPE